MYQMTAIVKVRLTRPKLYNHADWTPPTKFIWADYGTVDLKADTIEHLAYLSRHHADKLHRTWPSDALEAVKIEGQIELEGTRITFTTFDDRLEDRRS